MFSMYEKRQLKKYNVFDELENQAWSWRNEAKGQSHD